MDWLTACARFVWRLVCGVFKVIHGIKAFIWLLDRWNDSNLQ